MFDLFEDEKDDKAMLYYLYMMSDGDVSYSEEKLFDEICKKLRIEADDKHMIISKCKELATNQTDIYDVIIREKIDEKLTKHAIFPGSESRFAEIVWNLINLGYADGEYSENEKKIVRYLITRWEVDTEVYQEMI